MGPALKGGRGEKMGKTREGRNGRERKGKEGGEKGREGRGRPSGFAPPPRNNFYATASI